VQKLLYASLAKLRLKSTSSSEPLVKIIRKNEPMLDAGFWMLDKEPHQ